LQALRHSPLYSEVILAPKGPLLTFPVPAGLQRDIPNSLLSGCLEAGRAATPGFFLFETALVFVIRLRETELPVLLSAAQKTAPSVQLHLPGVRVFVINCPPKKNLLSSIES